MKRLLFLIFFSLVIFHISGQTSLVNQAKAPGMYLADGSKLNEYKKTFEIKDVQNPDNATLSRIDMSKYWKFMNATQRVEVIDDVTNLTLILYSHSESKAFIDYQSVLIVMPADYKRDETKMN